MKHLIRLAAPLVAVASTAPAQQEYGPLGPPTPRAVETHALIAPPEPPAASPTPTTPAAPAQPRDKSAQGPVFVALELTHLSPSQRIRATGGRTDVAQDFDTGLSGFTLTLGRRFSESPTGAHRLGASVAFLFDGVPAFVPQFGDAVSDEWHQWWGDTDNTADEPGRHHRRTEAMATPVTLFYDYEYNFGAYGVRAYAGPTLGFTTHRLATNFSGKVASSTDAVIHYGLHAGISIPIGDSDTHLRFEYEWRREGDSTYSPGVDLRIENRTDHLFSAGITASY